MRLVSTRSSQNPQRVFCEFRGFGVLRPSIYIGGRSIQYSHENGYEPPYAGGGASQS
jgi:hypothetical protein